MFVAPFFSRSPRLPRCDPLDWVPSQAGSLAGAATGLAAIIPADLPQQLSGSADTEGYVAVLHRPRVVRAGI